MGTRVGEGEGGPAFLVICKGVEREGLPVEGEGGEGCFSLGGGGMTPPERKP